MVVLTYIRINDFDKFTTLFAKSGPIFVEKLRNSSATFFSSKMSVLLTVILNERIEDFVVIFQVSLS